MREKFPGYFRLTDKQIQDQSTTALFVFDANILLNLYRYSNDTQRPIEPCDLIYLNNDSLELMHMKVSTRSAGLSHLFNQGLNAVELLRMNDTAKDNLKNLPPENEEMHSLIDVGNYSILYGIITKNDRDKKSKSLPIFSRISLLRTINALKLMNIPVTVYLIYDNVERKRNQE